ncbi:MAG: hypothetical protein F6K47_28955 [Symploca sp. SIO2E6]|nr:hypothetical protein [Symploca sp. SIO2E6]
MAQVKVFYEPETELLTVSDSTLFTYYLLLITYYFKTRKLRQIAASPI